MANVSLTQAAKLAGISRATLYRKYINTGLITVNSIRSGKKKIDTSEIIRVFGELRDTDKQEKTQSETDKKGVSVTLHEQSETVVLEQIKQSAEVGLLHEKLKSAESQVRELQADKQWLQSQIVNLTDSIKLLESPNHSRHWWKFWTK